MAFRPESFTIKKYIEETYPELVAPIETFQWSQWKSGDNLPNGKKVIGDSLVVLAGYLASVDGEILSIEIDFLKDIVPLFSELNYTVDSVTKSVHHNPIFSDIRVPATVQVLDIYDKTHGTNYSEKARPMFFRFANAYIKADGNIAIQEQETLSKFKQLLYPNDTSKPSIRNESTPSLTEHVQKNVPTRSLEDLLTELNSFIGLETVKNDVIQMVNFLKVQQMRQTRGMLSVPVSRHLVFYGNPGTGKTTIARLLALIYKSLNVISTGHLVETDRSGLVAGYVGQTAIKVREVVSKAIGGVLFIDEAYSLTGEGQDYGSEAVDTSVKLMEDNRDDLIVIVAGYTEKMNKFLQSNPGLKSRFNKYFSFEDYSPTQLVSIFELFCKSAGFLLTPEARDKVFGIFILLSKVKDETFGNARLARNVFEQTINNQANRIISIMDITEQTLSTIEVVDVPGEVEIHAIRP